MLLINSELAPTSLLPGVRTHHLLMQASTHARMPIQNRNALAHYIA